MKITGQDQASNHFGTEDVLTCIERTSTIQHQHSDNPVME